MTMPIGGDDLVLRAALRDELSGPLQAIRAELTELGGTAEVAGRRANIGARGFDAMARGVGSVARVAGRGAVLALKGITIGAVAAAGAATYLGIKTASSMQQAKIGFTTMLGSAQKASRFLKSLQKFAAATPFEFPELQTASNSLIAAGIHANKIIPIMTTLGDVTAGVGTGSEGIRRATVALQQMIAAQAIHGQDLNQLRDAGIPVYDLLAKATGKSKKEVVALAQAGKLGKKELDQLMHALETGKGLERFSGLMEKQSHTLAGVWSTLKDNVQLALAKAIKPAIPALTSWVESAGTLAQTQLPRLTGAIGDLITKGQTVWALFREDGFDVAAGQVDNFFAAGGRVAGILIRVKNIGRDVFDVLDNSLIPAVRDVAHAAAPLAFGAIGLLVAVLHQAARHGTITKDVIIAIVTALTVAKVATVAYNVVTAIANGLAVARAAVVGLLTGAVVAETAAEGFNNQQRAAGIAIGIRAAAMWAIQLARTIAVTAATGAWTAAQWLLNFALDANPIGLVVIAIAALAAGIFVAYRKSETFRSAVDTLWGLLKRFWKFTPFGVMIEEVKALVKVGAKVVGWVKDLVAWIGRIHWPSPPGWMKAIGGGSVKGSLDLKSIGAPGGDTATSRARGHGNLAATFAAHARYAAAAGGGVKVSNALIGGGGRGRGSGDHQAGRALDLVGRNLGRYARSVRADGGYAAMHGAGATRHLHAVPAPMGDTRVSHARRTSPSSSNAGGRGGDVLIAPGAIVVHAEGLTEAQARRLTAGAIADYVRDREERR